MIFAADKQEQRLKWAFENCKNGAWGSEPDGEDDVICIRAADFDAQSGQLNDGERTLRSIAPEVFGKIALRRGDLVMEKSGGGEKQLVGRTVLFDDNRPSVCSNFLARCRPADGIDPAYLNYLMLAIYAGRGTWPHIKQSTGIQNLDLGSYLDTRVSIPALPVQQRITRFLDEKTARIDALIEKKQVLLERLAEKRQALITRAVTKGLNPNAPMKPSGVDWLGEIPSHWQLKRLRFLCDRGTLNGLYKPKEQFSSDGVPFVQMGEAFRSEIFDGETKDRVLSTDIEVEKWGLKLGDFLIARRSLVFEGSGKSVMIGDIDEDHLFESSMIRLRLLSPRELSAFFSNYFRSSVCRAFVLSITKQVTISGIDSQQLKDVLVPLPPDEEAQEISKACERVRSGIETTEVRAENSITMLSEYRSALITAAVTGQLPELNG